MKIYVASSWRNVHQQGVVKALRDAGHEVYDFKNPREGDNGFGWKEIDPAWEGWSPSAFVEALNHPVAVGGFNSDWSAMLWADACVLVLPCGRSAHIEAGYFVGAKKPLHIYVPEHIEPELMYRMASRVHISFDRVLAALHDEKPSASPTSIDDVRAIVLSEYGYWSRAEAQTDEPNDLDGIAMGASAATANILGALCGHRAPWHPQLTTPSLSGGSPAGEASSLPPDLHHLKESGE